SRGTLELVRAYNKIREARVRKRIFEMVKAVGAASHAELLGLAGIGLQRRRRGRTTGVTQLPFCGFCRCPSKSQPDGKKLSEREALGPSCISEPQPRSC